MDFLLFLLAMLLGLIPAYIARAKGHSFFFWWVYGTLIFIVALPMSIFLKKDEEAIKERELGKGVPLTISWTRL
jgi:predicted ABC-type exoprotein transport system permease subunit